MKNDASCESCAWWKFGETTGGRDSQLYDGLCGVCHRYPPGPESRSPESRHPITEALDWCGEWSERK